MKQTSSIWIPLKIMVSVLLLCSQSMFSQTGVSLYWDKEIGCIVFSNPEGEPRDPVKDHISLEDIQDGLCIKFCENRHVTYTLSGVLGATSPTVWTATGGVITSHSDTSCGVTWGVAGAGSLTFSYDTPDGILTKTLCVEKILNPIADFDFVIANHGEDTGEPDELPGTRPITYLCRNQTMYFHDLSTANNGTGLVTWLWDFGDDLHTTSSASNPSFAYIKDGEYFATLTVTNACGCTSSKKLHIIVKSEGFDILCPGVVCEGQTATYSLPFEGREICEEKYNWVVDGGEINGISASNGDVTVTWNHVDESGFGYVTFYPLDCRLDCLLPTTIKIPVITQVGTIVGSANLCEGQQGIYKLPQWPTTLFQWTIDGDPTSSAGQIVFTDQRNEIVVTALHSGTIVLRCTYQNTLLHCGGMAVFTITVGKSNSVLGNSTLCQGGTATYTNSNDETLEWTITRNQATVASHTGTSITYTFPTSGTYTVSAIGAGLCSNISQGVTVIGIPATPVIAAESGILNSRTVCPDAPYSYSIDHPLTNVRYRWEVSPAGSGTIIGSNVGTQVNIQFNNNATHDILVYAESLTPILCTSNPAIVHIATQAINADIVVYNVTPVTNIICHNSEGQYQVVDTGTATLYSGGGESYVWSITDIDLPRTPMPSLGSITQGQGDRQIKILWNNVTATTHAMVHLVIRKCTLVKTLDFEVIIVPAPIITIHASATSICANRSITFSIVPPLPSGTSVTWNFPEISITSSNPTISHQFYSNASTNLIRTVTASVNGCGGRSVALPVQITVFPAPTATNSLSGGNVFCTESSINCTLTAAYSGDSVQWYRNGVLIPGETTGTYQPTTWGDYYFITTINDVNLCGTQSNVISIIQFCPPAGTCVPSPIPQVTNTSWYECTSNGNSIHLVGSANPTPLSASWSIFGPVSTYTGNTMTNVPPGEYNIFYVATYDCNGEAYIKNAYQQIIVPYVPKFNFTKTCNSDGTFTIGVLSNTSFFDPVINRSFQYFYSTDGGTTWTTSITTADGTIGNSMLPGTYLIKLVVQGSLPGSGTQPACEYVMPSFTLTALPAMSIDIVTPLPISCHDTAVKFDVTNPSLGNTYLWTFDAGAQNTQQAPSRVFNDSGVQPVNVRVTNKDGCWRDLDTITVTIPPKCFAGTITPLNPPAVCSGIPVVLTYTPSVEACTPPQYVWMNGTQVIAGATGPTLSVTTNGFYWLKILSPNNCRFETPERIVPIFRTSPSLELKTEGTVCQYTNFTATAITDATQIAWSFDGVVLNYMANLANVMFNPQPPGIHTVSVTVTQGGCSTTQTQQVIVTPAPEPPIIKDPELIKCDPYVVRLSVESPVDAAVGHYTWSNGQQGPTIDVTNGGPYQVRLTVGGCSSTAQVDVPKNPENFSWIFPTGCVSTCDKESEGTLIGPSLELPYWSWHFNEANTMSGHDSFPAHYPLSASGTYSFVSNTGLCDHTTPPLNYTHLGCDVCNLGEIIVKHQSVIKEIKYCSFSVILTIPSGYTSSVTAVLSSYSDQAIISPATFTLNPGTHDYNFTFVPINGFTGGDIDLLLTITDKDNKICRTPFKIKLLNCGGDNNEGDFKGILADGVRNSMVLYPNPAQNELHIAYTAISNDSELAIYDLTGRLINSYVAKEPKGDWTLSLNNYAAGVYVVVLFEHGQVVLQKKLIKD